MNWARKMAGPWMVFIVTVLLIGPAEKLGNSWQNSAHFREIIREITPAQQTHFAFSGLWLILSPRTHHQACGAKHQGIGAFVDQYQFQRPDR